MVDYQRAVRRAIAMWGTHTPKKTQNKYKDKSRSLTRNSRQIED